MEPSIESDIPIGVVIVAFVFLMVTTLFINRRLRNRHLVRQGQVFGESGSILPIEHRIAANKEWASGQIRSKGSIFTIILWILALVWNLCFGGAFISSFSTSQIPLGGQIVLGILTCLGVVPLFFAIRSTIQQFRFGESVCCINGKAGVLNREIAGTIRTKVDVKPTGDYTISLACVDSYTTGSGKNRRTESTVLFQTKQIVPSAGKSSRAGIPFSILLPPYPPETGYQLARGNVNWQLNITAPVEGVDYSAMFIVPVFKMD